MPRYLVDVSKRDQSAALFGRTYASPFGIAPTGLASLFRPGADLMLAQAARDANIPFIMSGSSTASIEELAKLAPEHGWYQLYAARDKKISEEDPEARVFAPGAAPGELSPDEFWRRAMEHAGKRRFKEGVRELLLGAMSATERRGLIRFRRGLTNRDYLYSVRGPARESFRNIATVFEQVYFGRREATSESFREVSQEYQKSFRGAAS